MSAELHLRPPRPIELQGKQEIEARRPGARIPLEAVRTAVVQIFLLGMLFGLYRTVRLISAEKTDIAMSHAETLWKIERALLLPSEVSIQQLAMHLEWLILFANRYYVAVHFPLTIAVLLWLFVRDRANYRWARNVLVVASVAAMFIQVGVPMAPPRFLSHHGFVDTMAAYGPTSYPPGKDGLANQYAALPSLHVGWAIALAAVAWRMRHRVAKVLLTAHAVITVIVVVITANHYWIDGLLGTALVAAAWFVLGRIDRARRRHGKVVA